MTQKPNTKKQTTNLLTWETKNKLTGPSSSGVSWWAERARERASEKEGAPPSSDTGAQPPGPSQRGPETGQAPR